MAEVSLAELTQRSKDAALAVHKILVEIETRLTDKRRIVRHDDSARGMTDSEHQALGEGLALKRLKEWILSEDPKIR